MQWRDGDIVVSVPFKSGTTWTLNIAYQLREHGNPDFKDLYKEIDWIEFLITPDHTVDGIVKDLDERKQERRIFKTHSSVPDPLPFFDQKEEPQVKYVVVFRNPEEATGSSFPFLVAHSEEFYELFGMPGDVFKKYKDFADYYYNFFRPNKVYMQFYGNLKQWWPLRHKPNVLMLHYADMKKDHEDTVRKISEFLEFEHTEEEWKNILEYTSFPWMKKHCEKFEMETFYPFPFSSRGGMIRRGESNTQSLDGVTEEIASDLAAFGRDIISDEKAFHWLYNGGSLE